jgi:hypothetical protein
MNYIARTSVNILGWITLSEKLLKFLEEVFESSLLFRKEIARKVEERKINSL